MSALAELTASERAAMPSTPSENQDASERFVAQIRAEYREMPGLSLTLAQAARVLGTDVRQSKRALTKLLDEGLLVRDSRGAFRRRDVPAHLENAAKKPTQRSASAVAKGDTLDRPSPAMTTSSQGDLLEAIGVELPCLACDRPYRISLRTIRSSQLMMDDGCKVRHFSDCPPAAFAYLIDPALLAQLEEAVERIEVAAEGAGGRLVAPR
jgi:hypothetical protein